MKKILILLLFLILPACRKDFLNEQVSPSINEPNSSADFWALLDNENTMDQMGALVEASADDYFFTDEYYNTRTTLERNTYTWQSDIYNGTTNIIDWNIPYAQILNCNIVINGIKKITDSTDKDILLATALFKRSFAFYNLLQAFSQPYSESTSNKEPGIPIRLTTDVNEKVYRPSIQTCYNQIIADLTSSCTMLTQLTPTTTRNRPSKSACYAMLARVYLSQRNYQLAGIYADSALAIYNKLIDYNNISTTSSTPFSVTNDENLYTAKVPTTSIQSILPIIGYAFIDTTLYQSYANNDRRKYIYFSTYDQNKVRRKNGYDGTFATLYTGLATDEVYLIAAECSARNNQLAKAENLLNTLLQNRYTVNTYNHIYFTSTPTAVNTILQERRKELIMRCLRWSDIRRLNLQGDSIFPKRLINNTIYAILPNSKLYTLPIPPDVIDMSNIEQNPR